MGMVGFLTFGFTQAVCPAPPLSLKGGEVGAGYVIINGWAYLLASWNSHPKISYLVNSTDNLNLIYSPINAGGMDASFLFQSPQADCEEVFIPVQGNQPIYFPCDLFNPNATVPPNPSMFSNQTACHLSSTARSEYASFQTQGVPNKKGGYDKAGRVYYDWDDITPESPLIVYNGYRSSYRILNLILTL